MKLRASIVVLACRLATIAALAVAIPAAGCINTFESEILRYNDAGNDKEVAKIIAGLEADFKKDPSLAHRNDLAVARVLTHRYDEAIALLQETEQRFPGKAIVAANLGTAFELKGDNAEALRWIREGVRRDPKEHRGSEWLHVRILEAKQSLAMDPRWLETHTVLGVSFGTDLEPRGLMPLPADETGVPRLLNDVAAALSYQLIERTAFVKPPDPVIADLYAAQGDIEFGTVDSDGNHYQAEYAADLYRKAIEYGAVKTDLLNRRLNMAIQAQSKQPRKFSVAEPVEPYRLVDGRYESPTFKPWLIVAGIVIGVGGAWWWRRQNKVRRP